MELLGVHKNDDHEICSKYSEMGLGRDGDANKDQKLGNTEARAQSRSGLSVGNNCVLLSTMCFGLMCIFLVAAIVVLHIKLTAEREVHATHMLQSTSRDQTEKEQLQSNFNSLSQKKLELETKVRDVTAEKDQLQNNFNSLSQKKLELETKVRDVTAEKDQLQNNFNSLSQKKLELETKVRDVTAEKDQLQNNFNSLSQKKLELETKVRDVTAEKDQLQNNFNSLSQKKLELETRVRDVTAEKDQLQNNFNSLSQKKLELETKVRDVTAEKDQLQNNFNSLSQKKLELETRVRDVTAEKDQLQNNFNSLSQKKLELETRVRDLTTEKTQLHGNFSSLRQKILELETELTKLSKQASGICLFISTELKNWSDSRQYCRDHGADLVIINTEEKQRFLSSFVKDRAWIGLSDTEQEGSMTWVNNSPLKQGFWLKGEPNDQNGNEDCIELMPSNPVLNNWNDFPCSEKKKGICEK